MRSTASLMAAAALFALPALGSDTEPKAGTQQSKFATCAHESKGLRGEEHQKFMSECLRGHEAATVARKESSQRAADETSSQQNRMRGCNDEARQKNLHGDERRAFMSTCLKG